MRDKKAKEFSEYVHKNDYRINGELVSAHTFRVYKILKSAGIKKESVLSASMLHHSLDESTIHGPYIKEHFGQETFDLVTEYKELSNNIIRDIEPKALNQRLMLETYISIANNIDLLAIRVADKTDNIKSLSNLEPTHAKKAAERAMYIYAPLAKFLGFGSMVPVLEDAAFKYLMPKEFETINEYKKNNLKSSTKILKDFTNDIQTLLRSENINTQIASRKKHNYSIYKKLHKYKKQDENIDEVIKRVMDIIAMRIVVNSEEECYLVEDILNTLYQQIHTERDDYISKPKSSGYKSIHNIYKIENIIMEVQIKTKDMHEQNEYGEASHLAYKFKDLLDINLKNNPSVIKELNYWMTSKPEIDVFSKNVYVFTPQGHIRKLPMGSTVVDFAYEIHRDIGNNCLSATINGKIAKLNTILKNGDIVEITTSKTNKKPARDWLDFVVTARAKREIRKALRIED